MKSWWDEYLKYAQAKKVSPFPIEGEVAQARGIGLTFFPDSIDYARNYLLSDNVSFYGNNLNLANNTIFYFLNSTSAVKLDIVDPLIKGLLAPYLKTNDGQFDQNKFDRVLGELKDIFQYYMVSAGGQLAQILVRKGIAPEVSFLSWNGGEPIWISKLTNHVVYAINKSGESSFMPPHIFWPTTDNQISDYFRPNIVQIMDTFITEPKTLLSQFPLAPTGIYPSAKKILGGNAKQNLVNEFAARDLLQARLLPNPKYFTDETMTGVRILTQNEVSPDKLAAYNEAIFQEIRGVISDFLANAKSASDFKEGDYMLKNAFLSVEKK